MVSLRILSQLSESKVPTRAWLIDVEIASTTFSEIVTILLRTHSPCLAIVGALQLPVTWVAIVMALMVTLEYVATELCYPLLMEIDLKGGKLFAICDTQVALGHLEQHVDITRVQ